MLRALSSRKSRYGYDRVGEDSIDALAEPQLTRAKSVPPRIFGFSKKQQQKGSNENKSHPVLSLFVRKKKMTAMPEFARYMEYMKQGGRWVKDARDPVMYYDK